MTIGRLCIAEASLIQYCRHDAIIISIMTMVIINRRKVDAEER